MQPFLQWAVRGAFNENIKSHLSFRESAFSHARIPSLETTTTINTVNMSAQLSPPPDGNQNRTGRILGACLGFLVVSSIFVALRLYTRLFLTKSARWDDWTIVLALVLRSPSSLRV